MLCFNEFVGVERADDFGWIVAGRQEPCDGVRGLSAVCVVENVRGVQVVASGEFEPQAFNGARGIDQSSVHVEQDGLGVDQVSSGLFVVNIDADTEQGLGFGFTRCAEGFEGSVELVERVDGADQGLEIDIGPVHKRYQRFPMVDA